MANKSKSGKRTKSGRLSRAKAPLFQTVDPNDRVLERRKLFAFVHPTKGPDGRGGNIDQDICDGIGQLHALGLLDGYGVEPQDLRDAGRFYGEHFHVRYRETGYRTCKYERRDRSVSQWIGETAEDRKFDRMDECLKGFERSVVQTLVVDNFGDDIVPWALAMIDEALAERRLFRKGVIRFPDMNDRAMLEACVRGLVAIAGGVELRRAA